MALEGGYAAAAQFNSISDSAASAVKQVTLLAERFTVLGTSIGGLNAAVKAFADLQATLTLTQSVAQGTSQEFKQMSDAARNLALGMQFTASQTANALYSMASAGLSVQESIQALGGVAELAQGTLSDLAGTTDTVVNVMNAFGMKASETSRIVNVLQASAAVSQATMDKLSYSLRYVAPVAAQVGATIEDTVASLDLLYNAGNRGQQAGALLRDVMVRLIDPSKEASEIFAKLGFSVLDAQGKVRPFVDLMRELQGLNLSEVTLAKIFQTRGIAGAETLFAGFDPQKWKQLIYVNADAVKGKLTEFGEHAKAVAEQNGAVFKDINTMFDYQRVAITNTTMATRIAAEQAQSLSSSFSRARNAVTEFGMTVGENLAPILSSLADSLTSAATYLRGMSDANKELLVGIPVLVLGVAGLTKAFTAMGSSAQIAFLRTRDAFRDLRGGGAIIGPSASQLNQFRQNQVNGIVPGAAIGSISIAAEANAIIAAIESATNRQVAEMGVLINTDRALIVAIQELTSVQSRSLLLQNAAAIGLHPTGFDPHTGHPVGWRDTVTGGVRSRPFPGVTASAATGGIMAIPYAAQGVQLAPVVAPAPVTPPAPPPATRSVVRAAIEVAGGLAAIAANAVGIGFAIIGVAQLAEAVLPYASRLISDLFKGPGQSSIPAGPTQEQTRASIQQVMVQPLNPFEKDVRIGAQQEDYDKKIDFWSDALKQSNLTHEKIEEELRKYVTGLLSLNGRTKMAQAVQKLSDKDLTALINHSGLVQDLANKDGGGERFNQLRGAFNNSARDVESAKANIQGAQGVLDIYANVRGTLRLMPGFDKYESEANEQKVVEQQLQDHKRVVLLMDWLSQSEKDARSLQLKANEAVAAIKSDPIQKFVLDSATVRQQMAQEILSFNTKLSEGFDKNVAIDLRKKMGNAFDNDTIQRMLSGQDYTTNILDAAGNKTKNADGSVKTALHKNIDTLLREDSPVEEIEKALREQSDLILNNIDDANQIKKDVARILDTRNKGVLAALLQARVQEAQKFIEMLNAQETNREFVSKMHDALIAFQDSYLKAIVDASGGLDLNASTQIGLHGLEKTYSDNVEEIRKRFLLILQKTNVFSPLSTDQLRYEALTKATNWAKQAGDALTQATRTQLEILKQSAANAAAKQLDDLKTAQMQMGATRSQIAEQIVSLYGSLNLPLPRGAASEAVQTPFREEGAQIQSQIAAIRDQIRQAQSQISTLKKRNEDIKSGKAVEDFGLPPEAIGGPADQMGTAIKTATEGFNTQFESVLKTFNTDMQKTLADGAAKYAEAVGNKEGAEKLRKEAEAVKPVQVPARGSEAFRIATGSTVRPDTDAGKAIINGIDGVREQKKLQDDLKQAAKEAADAERAGNEKVVAALEQKIAGLQKELQLVEQLRAAHETSANEQQKALLESYDLETKRLQQQENALKVSNDFVQGMRTATEKAMHELPSIAQLGAQSIQTLSQSMSSNITNLIMGKTKSWKEALANIAGDVAQKFISGGINELVTRGLNALVGGKGGFGSLLGGPTGLNGQSLTTGSMAVTAGSVIVNGSGVPGIPGANSTAPVAPVTNSPLPSIPSPSIVPGANTFSSINLGQVQQAIYGTPSSANSASFSPINMGQLQQAIYGAPASISGVPSLPFSGTAAPSTSIGPWNSPQNLALYGTGTPNWAAATPYQPSNPFSAGSFQNGDQTAFLKSVITPDGKVAMMPPELATLVQPSVANVVSPATTLSNPTDWFKSVAPTGGLSYAPTGTSLPQLGMSNALLGGAGLPSNIDPATLQAINSVAATHGISPVALSGLIKTESGFNMLSTSPGGRYTGLTQIGPDDLQSLGISKSQWANMSPAEQVNVYGDWLDLHKFSDRNAAAGIDLSQMSDAQQAAFLQANQFAPNAMAWRRNFDAPSTLSPQASALGGDYSVNGMTPYYQRLFSRDPARLGTLPGGDGLNALNSADQFSQTGLSNLGMNNLTNQMQESFSKLSESFSKSASSLPLDLTKMTESFGKDVPQLANSLTSGAGQIGSGIGNMANTMAEGAGSISSSIQSLSKSLLGGGGGGGGFGNIFGGLGNLFGGGGGAAPLTMGEPFAFPAVFHRGGLVGLPSVTRPVRADIFFGAPRYHTGLGNDEFPAILQRGERVLTREQSSRTEQVLNRLIDRIGNTRMTTNDQVGSRAYNPTMITNVYAKDADSFRKSEGQLFADSAVKLQRLGTRNN